MNLLVVLTWLIILVKLQRFADKLLKSLKTPHKIGSYELYISSSIGISLYPHDGKTVEELIEKS